MAKIGLPKGSGKLLKVREKSVKSQGILKWILSGNPALTLNAPIATKVVCFYRLLKCLRSIYGKQCGPRTDCSYRSTIGAVCSGSTLFASILNSSVI